jgi:hypothetical protein
MKRRVRRAYWRVLGVDGRIILKLKIKELVLRFLTGSVWIVMLFAGRLCDGVVERMFFVSSECLDHLRDCDTVTQCHSALNCVGVWQAVQTWQCCAEGSFLLCCCTMMTGKFIQLF